MSNDLLELLIRGFLLSSLGIAAVLLLRPLWRRWLGSENVLRLWLLVPLLALLPLLPARTVVVELAPASLQATQSLLTTFAAMATGANEALTANSDVTVPGGVDGGSAQFDEAALILAFWVLGALLFALWQSHRQRSFYLALGPLRRQADGLYRAARPDVGPMVLGLVRPRVVLPLDFEQRFSATQRHLVLQHEFCHLARGDLWFAALALVLRCLYWFNPLVHLAWTRFREDQELACDATVIRQWPKAKRAYAEAMLLSQPTVPGLPVGCTWQSSHPLQRRIEMMYSNVPATSLRLGMFASLLVPCCLAGIAWAQSGTQVVMETRSPVLLDSIQVAPTLAHEPAMQLTEVPRAPAPVAALEPDAPSAFTVPERAAPTASHASPPPIPPGTPSEGVIAAAMPVEAAAPLLQAEPAAHKFATGEPLVIAAADQSHPRSESLPGDKVEPGEVFATDRVDEQPGTKSMTAAGQDATDDLLVLAKQVVPAEAADSSFVPARIVHAERPLIPGRLSLSSLVYYPGTTVNRSSLRLPASSGQYAELLIEVDLDASGQALRVEAAESGARPGVSRRNERAAIRAIRDWRFEPARLDGHQVASTLLVPFSFELDLSTRHDAIRGPVEPLIPGGHSRGTSRPRSERDTQLGFLPE